MALVQTLLTRADTTKDGGSGGDGSVVNTPSLKLVEEEEVTALVLLDFLFVRWGGRGGVTRPAPSPRPPPFRRVGTPQFPRSVSELR